MASTWGSDHENLESASARDVPRRTVLRVAARCELPAVRGRAVAFHERCARGRKRFGEHTVNEDVDEQNTPAWRLAENRRYRVGLELPTDSGLPPSDGPEEEESDLENTR